MKINTFLVLILITLLVFSFGCTTIPAKSSGSSTTKGFKFSGNDGISVSFDKNAPPLESYQGDEIPIVLVLENKGAVEVDQGVVKARLRGEVVNSNYYQTSSLESTNQEVMPSAEREKLITDSRIDLGTIIYTPEEMFVSQVKPEIIVEVCHPFSTLATSKLHILGQIGKTLSSSPKVSNSAGPIKIKNLKTMVSKGKTRFTFDIVKSGSGRIVDSCFPDEYDNYEVVSLDILQPAGVTCNLDGRGVTLYEKGKRTVTCEVAANEGDDYETELSIKLDYNYDRELKKKITIKKLEVE